MKKVLIISYYWVPSGGAGVQRWVKFTRYLRDYGWEPVIFTPSNPEYPSIDESFEQDIPNDIEVVKIPIWEPYNIYRNLFGKQGQAIPAGFISENKKSGWKEKLSIAIRGNFLIPDPRRFWIKPAVKYLSSYLKDNPVNAVVTTGPPHSMHLIALRLKKLFPHITWIADFRDPWTNIDFYKDLNLTKWADRLHHKLEKRVIQGADAVVVVSKGMEKEYISMNPASIHVIPNGFDEEDFKTDQPLQMDEYFSLSHIGTLNAARNPSVLWKALAILCAEDNQFKSDLRINLIGKVDYSVVEDIYYNGLKDNLIKIDYLPHREAVARQQSSQLLLLLINRTPNASGIITGKCFEYLASGRPVLGIGPVDGDAANLLQETGSGKMVGFEDVEALTKTVRDYYKLYKNKALTLDAGSVAHYSRKSLTEQLANLLNQLISNA